MASGNNDCKLLKSGDSIYSTLRYQMAKHGKAIMCNHPSYHDLGQPKQLTIVTMHWAIVVSLSSYKRNDHAVYTAHSVQACSNLNLHQVVENLMWILDRPLFGQHIWQVQGSSSKVKV